MGLPPKTIHRPSVTNSGGLLVSGTTFRHKATTKTTRKVDFARASLPDHCSGPLGRNSVGPSEIAGRVLTRPRQRWTIEGEGANRRAAGVLTGAARRTHRPD